MTRCALAHGDRVLATLRKPSVLADFASKYSSTQLVVAKLDVFIKAVLEIVGDIDVTVVVDLWISICIVSASSSAYASLFPCLCLPGRY